MLKVMCATSKVPKPSEKPSRFPVNTNSSIRETPVMMSALVMGMLLMVMSRLRGRRFMEKKPMAAAVPRMVAMTEASTDTVSVVLKADRISSSWNSSVYQWKEKPDQTVRLLESLKEKMMRSFYISILNIFKKQIIKYFPLKQKMKKMLQEKKD